EASRLLLGLNCARPLEAISLPDATTTLAETHSFDLQAFRFSADKEFLRQSRVVRVGLIQNSIAVPTTCHFADQKKAIMDKIKPLIDAAGASGVNIMCLQEAWTMPFAFCTREKRWCEFAEPVDGESTQFLQELAQKYNMVIVSPILERDINHGETIWNTAVVIGNNGNIIGIHRKNHIPRVGDFNESTYYMEGNTGHPVFETAYGKIGVNICYGRHHPLNWLAFGLNGAEIVFNPSATVGELSEPMWPIEEKMQNGGSFFLFFSFTFPHTVKINACFVFSNVSLQEVHHLQLEWAQIELINKASNCIDRWIILLLNIIF
ncbi:hypothetical protein ACJX0J_032103, partial [Zea mays]